MRLFLALIACLVAALPARALDLPAPADLVHARIAAESKTVAPGSVLWADIHLEIKPGWHMYWRNPGDAGLPTAIAWHLPPGFSAGAIEWPVPERFTTGDLVNYGYKGAVDLLVPVSTPASLEAQAPIAATVTWLACTEICIPGESELSLDLPAGTATPDPAEAAQFAAARARMPQPAPFPISFAAEPGNYRLLVPTPSATAAYFPYNDGAIDLAAPQRLATSADGVTVTLARPSGPARKQLEGVLVLDRERAYTVSASPAPLPAEPEAAWWEALLLALAGGVILNLMPCVFPILSLKVLSLASLAHRRAGLRHGFAYAAGVVLSFAALGGLLLVLRAGGDAVGWGFQLQSPLVVGLLAYLLLAMGLSFSGVAEFGGGFTGIGSSLADRTGVAGAFAAGILATVVATPCTAPFMGTALGFALVAPAPAAFGVFLALGVGLAAPFLLVAALPGAARMLPRPGAWMVTLRQVLAFPLYGTVAWLIWVLAQEVEPSGALMVMFGLVAVAFAVWVYGRTRMSGRRRLGEALAALGLAAAIGLAATVGGSGAKPRAVAARDGLPYEAFTSARLAALTADKKPVFVNLTASWCITCLVNERATLDRAAVRRAFAAHGVIALKGDWTRRNPDITAFLQRHGRSGVPLYLLYDRSGDATVLPQILTETTVIQAIGRI